MSSYYNFYHPTANVEKPKQHLEIEVRHVEGGVSYFDGRHRRRGLTLAFQTMDLEFHPSGEIASRSFMLFGGEDINQAFHVTTLMRRNEKRAMQLAAFVKANQAEIIPLAMAKDWAALDALLTRFEFHDRHPALV